MGTSCPAGSSLTFQRYGTLLAQHHVRIDGRGKVAHIVDVQQQIQVIDALLAHIQLHIVHGQGLDVRELVAQLELLDLGKGKVLARLPVLVKAS